jgi:hypothetical protein
MRVWISLQIVISVTPVVVYEGVSKKFPDWVDKEMDAYNNKHSLRSNTKGYGGKTH